MAPPRTPPLWSVAFLLSLVLLVSTAVSLLWVHGAAALGVPVGLAQRGTFLWVEVFGILLPAVALAKLLELDARATFPAERPRVGVAVAAVTATLGLSVLLTYFQDVYQKAFGLPYPEALLEILAIRTPLEGLLLVAGVVLAAATCEEVVFRGYIQASLQERLKPWAAIVLTAVLFAAFHLEPAGLPTYLLLGVWLSWLRWASASLWLPILAHATNNLLALVQVNVLGEAVWLANAAYFIPAALLLAMGGGYACGRMLARGRGTAGP